MALSWSFAAATVSRSHCTESSAASLVLQEQLHQQILDHRVGERGTRIVRLGRRQLDAVAVARVGAGALELLEAHQRLAQQPARQVQQPSLRFRRQLLGRDAGAAAEGVEPGVHVLERQQAEPFFGSRPTASARRAMRSPSDCASAEAAAAPVATYRRAPRRAAA